MITTDISKTEVSHDFIDRFCSNLAQSMKEHGAKIQEIIHHAPDYDQIYGDSIPPVDMRYMGSTFVIRVGQCDTKRIVDALVQEHQ